MKYLVVDDSKLARLTLIKSLKEHVDESQIIQASNGADALEIAKENKLSIVFLDLTMPVMDGYEALPKILKINPKVKVVVVSADIQEKAQQKVIGLGAELHIQKPINSTKMKEILEILG